MTAAACFAFGLFVLLALVSYNNADPSWNTASTAVTANWMGIAGAWVSDLFLQTIGGGAFILSATFMIWGLRTFKRQPVGPIWARLVALLVACIFGSVAMAQIPTGDWIVHPYLGASAGTMLLNQVAEWGQNLGPGIGHSTFTLVSGAIAFSAFLYAAAVRRDEIINALYFVRYMLISAFVFVARAVQAFNNWIQRNNENYHGPSFTFPKLQLPAKPKHVKKPVVQVAPPSEAADAYAEPPPPVQAPPAEMNAPHIPVVTPQRSAVQPRVPSDNQQRFALSEVGEWDLPALSLIQAPPEESQTPQMDDGALRKNAELLQNVLADFNVQGDIVSIHPGPVVTLYEFEPAPGVKTSRVVSLADDIARSMSAVSVRIAVVPGRSVIGIELPNKERQVVYMQDMLASRIYEKSKAKLPLILGKDIGGQPILADLAKMPHLLVAGTTGSGKSVAVNTMILSLLFQLPPEKCRFIMIDPKMLELSVYDGIPHLLSPVVTEPGKAVVSLKWAVQEMEERYRAMSKLGVRNIEGYNARLAEARKKGESLMHKVQTGFDPESGKPVYEEQAMDLTELPYIVIIVDEFADLMLVAGKDVENAIQRLAQMARAAGIHLIMATQRPSVDVITGVIKANFPTRISFSVTSKIDSRTILGEGGAEQLLGMGDMLYMAPGGRITRVHGPFVSDKDVEKVTEFLRSQGDPAYLDDITEGGDFGDSEVMGALFGEEGGDSSNAVDELYDKAVALVAREGKASTSFVQRYLQIGYNRAARIVEEMEKQGIISPANSTGKREVLIRDFSDV